ncbi:Uncharacterized protein dnm_075020 [Desulfonema magnum]|uniref:Uncharacterized protein n=1 Tax=Desulfonema magnum TaxID=45655 RepID=A0A975BUK9_9BACT|nr:Uncharacterized protein dnm_075020 [Desulfonema magnum]
MRVKRFDMNQILRYSDQSELFNPPFKSYNFTVIHFEKPSFLSEDIFITGGEKTGFFYERLFNYLRIKYLIL